MARSTSLFFDWNKPAQTAQTKETTPMSNSHFKRGSGCYTCTCCKKLTRSTGASEEYCGLCERCFEMSGDENSVSDGGISESDFFRTWGLSVHTWSESVKAQVATGAKKPKLLPLPLPPSCICGGALQQNPKCRWTGHLAPASTLDR